MVRRIHHRLSYILIAVTGFYLALGFMMIVAKRGLSYRPNPSAPAEISDQLKESTGQYVNYIDWIYDTSKNTIPLSANHVARYNPLDLKIVGALFVVSAISIGLHNVWEKKHVQA